PLVDGSQSVVSSVGLSTLRFSSSYNAGAAWSMGASVGISNVRAGDKSGHGNDISLNTEYKPSQKLDVQFVSSQSTSGALATLAGFQTGFGIGYGGNGFSSGVSNLGLIGSVGNNYRSNMLSVLYQLTPRINLATRLNTGSSSGTIASNSTFRTAALDLDWD